MYFCFEIVTICIVNTQFWSVTIDHLKLKTYLRNPLCVKTVQKVGARWRLRTFPSHIQPTLKRKLTYSQLKLRYVAKRDCTYLCLNLANTSHYILKPY